MIFKTDLYNAGSGQGRSKNANHLSGVKVEGKPLERKGEGRETQARSRDLPLERITKFHVYVSSKTR